MYVNWNKSGKKKSIEKYAYPGIESISELTEIKSLYNNEIFTKLGISTCHFVCEQY